MATKLNEEISSTAAQLKDALALFTQDEFNIIPFEGSWTAGQVGEHLMKGVDAGILYGSVQPTNRNPEEKVESVKKVFLDFTTKMKSPPFTVPSNGPHKKEIVADTLAHTWQKLKEAAETLDLSLTCTDFAIPGFGEFTRQEWIWFYVFHTQRHIHQLKNIYKKLEAAPAEKG